MTLFELMDNAIIQGDVRVSVWKGDDEVKVIEVKATDDLTLEKKVRKVEDLDIRYMFASPVDGMLHIELELPEEV